MTRTRAGCGRARGLVVCSVALGGLLLLVSAAWACTAVMGKLELNPTSGRAGSTVKASATGLKVSPAKYRLVFINSQKLKNGVYCHSATGPVVIKRDIATNRSGAFSVYAQIPSTAPRGTSQICGLETYPVRNQTATTHQTFTVL
jgi:hypothetical protein